MRGQEGESRQSIPVERTSKYSLQSDFAGTRAVAEDMHFCTEVIPAHAQDDQSTALSVALIPRQAVLQAWTVATCMPTTQISRWDINVSRAGRPLDALSRKSLPGSSSVNILIIGFGPARSAHHDGSPKVRVRCARCRSSVLPLRLAVLRNGAMKVSRDLVVLRQCSVKSMKTS
jgi:hypothetical protein